MIATDSPDLEDVIEEIVLAVVGPRLGPLPGKVVAFDRSTGLATVSLAVKLAVENESGGLDLVETPPAVSCPVAYFAVGGMLMYADLAVGDAVTILHADRDISEWVRRGGAEPRDPIDRGRRLALQDAIVYPGLLSSADVPSTRAGKLTLGERVAGARIEIGGGKVRIGTPAVDLVAQADALAEQTEALAGALATLATATTTYVSASATALPALAPAAGIYATAVSALPADLGAIGVALAAIRVNIQALKE